MTAELLSLNVTSDDYIYPRITEDDAFIEQAVAQAEPPALLAALTLITNDPSILTEDLRPPLPPMDSTIKPQGGMSPAAQARARQVAVTAIREFRDRGCVVADETSPETLRAMMGFLTKDAGDEYIPLLQHELGVPEDYGQPSWTKGALAPDVAFRVAVIGAGISGMAAAHRLNQAGVDFVMFDKNAEVGGTWWENCSGQSTFCANE